MSGRDNGWRYAGDISKYITEDILKNTDINGAGTLVKDEDGAVLLAFPAAEHEPFNLEPLFCFAEICDIAGRDYAVFRLDGKGDPIMPPEE